MLRKVFLGALTKCAPRKTLGQAPLHYTQTVCTWGLARQYPFARLFGNKKNQIEIFFISLGL